VLKRLLAVVRAPIQLAEAGVAVRDERAHAAARCRGSPEALPGGHGPR
jgi:hypothetical protein